MLITYYVAVENVFCVCIACNAIWCVEFLGLSGQLETKLSVCITCENSPNPWIVCIRLCKNSRWFSRVRKYAKFGVFYAKIVQMTPQRLRRESLQLQKFSVTNSEPLRLQKFSVTVLPLPFSQQIEFTLIVNVVNLN